MTDYTTYLAANVLNDGKTVSYRLLARELKVHGNKAKRMLYEFHKSQNKKKPSSVHACYVIDGVLSQPEPANNDDNDMNGNDDSHPRSSPFMSSAPTHDADSSQSTSIPVRQIVVTKEEHLETVYSRFEKIASCSVYSLSPTSLQNLEQLSDCNRTVSKQFIDEDPLKSNKQYGTIQNSRVKRRTGNRPPIPQAPLASEHAKQAKPSMAKSNVAPAQASQGGVAKKPADSMQDTKPQATGRPASSGKGTKQPAGIKRESSDLFKSFSKAKPKLQKQDTGSSRTSQDASTLPQDDDEPMKEASEDEQPEDFALKVDKEQPPSKSRSEREEDLRRMMEDDDDDEEQDVEMKDTADEPAEEEPEEPSPEAEPSKPEEPSMESEPTVTVSGGRRRGRRRVMKKKTIKDDEGYLVTKEEPAWESFSEDEPPPSSKDKAPFSTPPSSAKSKKPGGKPGQGNIMNFFGKR